MRFSDFESSIRFATDKYLFFANSLSKRLICSGVKAVLGRFLGAEVSCGPSRWALTVEFDDGGVIGISGAKLVSRSLIDSENLRYKNFKFLGKMQISDPFLFESWTLK